MSPKKKQPPNPERTKLAKYIISKFVLEECLNYGRDMTIAYKLADRHPEPGFWEALPAKRQINSLVIFWSQESRDRLTREYSLYLKKLENQRNTKVEPRESVILGEKVGEDYKVPYKSPFNILEFCR